VRLVSWADTLADVARSLYVTSPEAETGKGTVAVGAVDLLTRQVGRVGVFRPVVRSDEQPDPYSSCCSTSRASTFPLTWLWG
jgi:BioD-like phosphotransacetylase family protein